MPAGSGRRRYWRSVLVLGGVVTVVRVGICWDLAYRAYSHHETLAEIPVIALLMPEYLLAPGDPATPAGMWSLTAALAVGSFSIVAMMALLAWRLRGGQGRNERLKCVGGSTRIKPPTVGRSGDVTLRLGTEAPKEPR